MTGVSAGEPAAVIATYRPDERLVVLVDALMSDCSSVVVIDDGSGDGEWDAVFASAERSGAMVVRRGRNDGIATALNVGIDIVVRAGAHAVFTFDQDSLPHPDFVHEMSERLKAARASLSAPVAAMVPEHFAAVSQARGRDLAPGVSSARKVIQSGMLIPADALRELGPMREDLFIDLVDTEFELRALSQGWSVMAARGVSLTHALGHRVRLRLFPGVRLTTSVSTPFRFYYRARNRIILTAAFVRRFPLRMAGEFAIDAAFFAIAILGARPRRALLSVVARGARDGVRRRAGRMPADIERSARAVTWDGDAVDA